MCCTYFAGFFFPVNILSSDNYIYIGDTARILCLSSIEVNIIWKFNGSIYYDESISNISISIIPMGSDLTWHSIPEQYNSTIVSCTANISGSIVLTSDNITIILQGIS